MVISYIHGIVTPLPSNRRQYELPPWRGKLPARDKSLELKFAGKVNGYLAPHLDPSLAAVYIFGAAIVPTRSWPSAVLLGKQLDDFADGYDQSGNDFQPLQSFHSNLLSLGKRYPTPSRLVGKSAGPGQLLRSRAT